MRAASGPSSCRASDDGGSPVTASAKGGIVAVCSLCSHEYARWFDEAETAEHMAEAHGMYFDPRPLRTLPPGER